MRITGSREKTKQKLQRLAWVGLLVLTGALLSLLPVGGGERAGSAAVGWSKPEVLRFHVLANSNSENDQALKLAVRDAVLREVFSAFGSAANLEVAKSLAFEQRDRMLAVARRVIAEWGRTDDVRVEIGRFVFPVKESGGLVLPAGRYEAVRLVIGAGEGHNWWCVMYPPLCVDVGGAADGSTALAAAPEETARSVPTVEAFRLYEDPARLTAGDPDEAARPEIRWAFLEWADRAEQALGARVRWLGLNP